MAWVGRFSGGPRDDLSRLPPAQANLPREVDRRPSTPWGPPDWAWGRASDRPTGLVLPIVPPGPANFAVRVGKQRRGPAKAAEGGNERLSERGLCRHGRSVAMGEPLGQPGHR